jgi:hypothetical protein
MKRIATLLIAASALIAASTPRVATSGATADEPRNWGKIAEGFQLSVQPIKSLFTNGQPVLATILLRNATNAQLTYFRSGREQEQTTITVRKNLSLLQPKKITNRPPTFEERVKAVYRGSYQYCLLAPGAETNLLSVDLSKVFDLSTHGVYIVQVARKVPKLGKDEVVQVLSNQASFSIVPSR